MIKFNHGIFDYKKVIPVVAATWPTDSLVARWNFEQNLTDGINNYTLSTLVSGWGYNTGKIGSYAYYNSAANGGSLENTTTDALTKLASGTNSFSYSWWMKNHDANSDIQWPLAIYVNGGGGIVTIVVIGGGSGGSPGKIQFAEGSNTTPYAAVDVRDGVWRHYVYTFDGTNQLLYMNGTSILAASTRGSKATNGNRFSVGSAVGSWPVHGYIDALYVYSKCLTTTEVSQLYNGGNGI